MKNETNTQPDRDNNPSQHTPAPWYAHFNKRRSEYNIYPTKGVHGIATVYVDPIYAIPTEDNKAKANAELIARAPELLKENERLHLLSAELTNSVEDLKEELQNAEQRAKDSYESRLELQDVEKENEQLKETLRGTESAYQRRCKEVGWEREQKRKVEALNAELLEALKLAKSFLLDEDILSENIDFDLINLAIAKAEKKD